MSTATKKPLASGVGRLSSTTDTTTSSSPSRPPRSSTPTAAATATTPDRRRSIRGGTPGATRVARGASNMSLSNATEMMDPEARAETVAIIEDLKKRHQDADTSAEQYRKQTEVLQTRLDEAVKENAKLEEKVHEHEEQIEALRNEKREAARQMREMENIYEAEKSSILKEKEEMSTREEEMQAVINRLKDTLNQRNADDDYRPSRQSVHSPSLEGGGFAPPSSINRSDSRNNSKLLLQKDKLIESLRLELAEAQIKLVETENQGGGRLNEVERLLMEARMANARLMEDNESYQLLLQEKTLHGDFGKGDFDYMGVSANQDALNALEGRSAAPAGSADPATPGSLADELGAASDDEHHSHAGEEPTRRLDTEVRMLKDQNKALTLYINKIIERLLQHQEFEHILDTSEGGAKPQHVQKELPPAPSEYGGIPSFLQRAKSIAYGAGASPRKARPMSMMHTAPQENSAHNNPETAPSIPIGLGRSPSARRRTRPMSEQFIGAAGVVNAMYKGPDGPLSPTLSNPRHSQTFFNANSRGSSYTGNGAPSAGNFPGMRSETSSISGDSGSVTGDGVSSTTQSPPRTINSVTSEKPGNATFTGNKPRPLRLVQEHPENKADKRGSWLPSFGGWGSS